MADREQLTGDRAAEAHEIQLWRTVTAGHDGPMTFVMADLDPGHARKRMPEMRPPRV